MKRLTLAIAGLPLLAAPSLADFDAGRDAFIRGDFAIAYEQFLPPAKSGDSKARVGMGLLHARGLGVPKDYVQAHSWFDLAANQDKHSHPVVRILAETNRDYVAKRMSPEQIAQAKQHSADIDGSVAKPNSVVPGFALAYRGKLPPPSRERAFNGAAAKDPQDGLAGSAKSGSAYRIQLAAAREATQKRMMRTWTKIAKRHRVLAGLAPSVSKVDLGSKGVFSRLRAGPFDSRSEARAACSTLRAAKQKCFVVAD